MSESPAIGAPLEPHPLRKLASAIWARRWWLALSGAGMAIRALCAHLPPDIHALCEGLVKALSSAAGGVL